MYSFESQFSLKWLDRLPTPIFILNQKGKISFCNLAVEELMGHSRVDIVGAGLDVYVARSDSHRFLRDELKLFRGTSLVRVKYTIVRRNGDLIHTITDLSPIFDSKQQKVQFIIGIVLETTRARYSVF